MTDLVKSLNIQFDNLCQFLPQDKVVEFARLDPYELLIATQKAIGDASLYDMHQELIRKRNQYKQDTIVSGRHMLHAARWCVSHGWTVARGAHVGMCMPTRGRMLWAHVAVEDEAMPAM